MKLPTQAAIAALDARTVNAGRLPELLEVGTDTRSVTAGSTFLALRGERFDGHAFVGGAVARGAAAVIVSDPASLAPGIPALIVCDTRQAYLDLAGLARERVAGPVIAISGSAGKTTTKAYLLALLTAADIPVSATPENENNEVGVSKFMLGLEPGDTRVAIVEMGARKYRDLDVLVAAVRPQIAVLTNIGDAHLEIMGSRERLARTKWGLFGRGARAVLDLDDPESRARAHQLAEPPLWFAAGSSQPPPGASAVILRDAATLAIYDGSGCVQRAVEVHAPGEHNRRNLAAALAAAIAAGYPAAALAAHLSSVKQPAKRYEAIELAGGKRLIFDAYNASLSGSIATLAAFAQEAAERRISVLGSMAELGSDAAQMHRRVGAAAAGCSDVILAGGDFAAEIVAGALAAGAEASRCVRYVENAGAVAWLQANARAGDAILLKGSRKYRMEEIADALLSASAP